ncbi:hypothetical protein JT359_15140 [Candidatus Poribacteria bacterium]|nr:hypothetical protein [Candidatus Poribacteria bacterium]
MKYLKLISLSGIVCLIGFLFIFGVKLQAKNSINKGSNVENVSDIKSFIIPDIEQIEISKDSSNWSHGLNYNDRNTNDNSEFYQIIIDDSLFRSLGWEPPNNEPEYTLLGTTTHSLAEHSKALLSERRTDAFLIVGIGENVGDMVLKEIEDKKIVLDKDGESITLRTRDIEFLKTGGSSSRNQDRSDNYENRDYNNDRSSETIKWNVNRNTSNRNRTNEKNLRTALKTARKSASKNAKQEVKSSSKAQKKITLEKKRVSMKLKSTSGKGTVQYQDK